jgi:hypothetical protein
VDLARKHWKGVAKPSVGVVMRGAFARIAEVAARRGFYLFLKAVKIQ